MSVSLASYWISTERKKKSTPLTPGVVVIIDTPTIVNYNFYSPINSGGNNHQLKIFSF